jgi:uncharacterized protein YicC (UPF0701 family)
MAFNNSDAAINADLNLSKRYIDIAEQIADQIDQPAPISPLDIMRWPGILKDQDIEPESLYKAAIETFSATVDQLLQGRQREGNKLADIIEQRLGGLQALDHQSSNLRLQINAYLNQR